MAHVAGGGGKEGCTIADPKPDGEMGTKMRHRVLPLGNVLYKREGGLALSSSAVPRPGVGNIIFGNFFDSQNFLIGKKNFIAKRPLSKNASFLGSIQCTPVL